jgi:serine/threonine-protein kinase
LQLLDLGSAGSASSGWHRSDCDAALAAELRAQLAAAEHTLPLLDRIAKDTAPPSVGQYRLIRELGRAAWARVAGRAASGDAVQQVGAEADLGTPTGTRRSPPLRTRNGASWRYWSIRISRAGDGGSDESGAPYSATVFVDGERLDRHVASQRLPLPQRVRLIVQIAGAVAYAHRGVLVVHRDLKGPPTFWWIAKARPSCSISAWRACSPRTPSPPPAPAR